MRVLTIGSRIMDLLMMADAAAPAAGGDVNAPPVVTDDVQTWTEGDLPSQGGGGGSALMPGSSTFLIPANIAQCWDTVDILDKNPKSKNVGKIVRRQRLKFTKESPLVVVDGPMKGETLTASFTSNPRARGKADDENTP
jgi:hypothetical protein